MLRRNLLWATALTTVMVGQAFADEYGTANQGQVTIQQAASMMAYSAGNDQAQVSIAPNWSDELGWSVRAAAGSYLGDAVALGAIVEYGDNKQEYLANLGLQLSETLSLIGTMGRLAEYKEFVSGEGEDKATQMEYGLSLKLARQEGQGFELNGYAVDAKASNDSIETGKLYGTEALVSLGLSDTTLLKIAGGYEWLEWDDGEKNDHWTFRTEANHQLTDKLGLQGHSKIGASERSYGGGLNFSLSNDGTNLLGLNYTQIDGRDGVADDKRVELRWTYGLGAGPASSVASADVIDKSDTISPAADVAIVSPVNSLLADVMKRPEFLPKRVLARAKAESGSSCPFTVLNQENGTPAETWEHVLDSYGVNVFLSAAPDIDILGGTFGILVGGDPVIFLGKGGYAVTPSTVSGVFTVYFDDSSDDRFDNDYNDGTPPPQVITFTASGTGYSCSIDLTLAE